MRARCVLLALVGMVWPLASAARSQTVYPERFELAGFHESRQLLITGKAEKESDLTRVAKYQVEPAGIVRVSETGLVRPVAKGETTISVQLPNFTKKIHVVVKEADADKPLDFANDIVPLLSRHGCNSGGCHGRASGQNGFRLSLFGFDPTFDFDSLVKEARGRRIMPASPDHSLLLTKAIGSVPHGGGRRLTPQMEDYRTLRYWILQGAPRGNANAPTLAKLSMVPDARVMDRNSNQQTVVLAHYSDGSVRDVTLQAQFQSNEIPVAAVDTEGLVRTFDLSGDATIMARYLGQVAIFRALVPLGKPIAQYPEFRPNNYIDELALKRWKQLGITPSENCTDNEFQRRVSLDLCGRLPTPAEVREFAKDADPRKREKLIDRLLEDRDYPAYFAMRWGNILRNASLAGSEQASYAFHDWIRDMIARNRPYDEFVRGVVAASGEWQDAPAVNWYWQMRDDQLHQPVADTAQVFLGLRLQCAKCHHHPYERWSQDDYYGLAGFFSRLGRKSLGEPPPYFSERRRTTGEVNPRTGKPIEPKILDGPELKIPLEDDPRHKLVDWMREPTNPFFAKAMVNRMWGHLMGRGLVDPIDDMRETNPPSNPEMLEALSADFIAKKFDVKHLLRTICNSRTYQLSAIPNEFNKQDKQNHARFYGRRLIAEVLHDAVDQTCGVRTQFNKMSKQARAIDLPHEGFGSYFLDVFDRPPRSSPCECARSNSASLSQVLHLANSGDIERKISSGEGRIAKLVQTKAAPETVIEDLYLAAFSRLPTQAERTLALDHVRKQSDSRRGLEDVLWSLLNSREFMFQH